MVKLSKAGWHYRLQQYVFGPMYEDIIPDKNFCPYFWLTIICLVAFVPIYAIRKSQLAFNAVADFVDDRICIPVEKKMVANLKGDSLLLLFFKTDGTWEYDHTVFFQSWGFQSGSLRAKKRFDNWKELQTSLGKDWKAEIEKIKQERLQFYETLALKERTKRAEKAATKAQSEIDAIRYRNFAIFCAKIISIPILMAVAALILYCLFLLGQAVVLNWRLILPKIFLGVSISLGMAVVLAIAFMIATLLKKCTWFSSPAPSPKRRGDNFVVKFIASFGDGVCEFFDFFKEYLAAMKQNYCPRIEWVQQGDKNGDKHDGWSGTETI